MVEMTSFAPSLGGILGGGRSVFGKVPIRRLRCSKCHRSPDQLIEHGTQTMIFDVLGNGAFRDAEGFIQEGDVIRLYAQCSCGHRWRVRGAVQITCVDVGLEQPK